MKRQRRMKRKFTSVGLTLAETRQLSKLCRKALKTYHELEWYADPLIRAFEMVYDVSSEQTRL